MVYTLTLNHCKITTLTDICAPLQPLILLAIGVRFISYISHNFNQLTISAKHVAQQHHVYANHERNKLMDTGLMQPQPNRTTTTSSPLLEQFRACYFVHGGSPRTLEEKLAALSDTELNSIMQTAKFVQMAMALKVAAMTRHGLGRSRAVNVSWNGIDRRSADC